MDGVNDKLRTGVRKTVHFGGARRIPEENKDEEQLEERAVATLSLSAQVPAGDVKTLGENGWREQSSMSQPLEKLRRAAEVFADPKSEKEVSDDERGVKAKEKVVQKVESIFKKPHRAAGKLTLSERKFEEEKVADKNEMFGENYQAESEEPMEVPKVEKKRVQLTIGVNPEDGLEKKNKVPMGGWEPSNDMEVEQQISHLRRNVVDVGEEEVELNWDPSAFVAEHMSMEVAPRWKPQEGWLKKDVVQPMEAWR